jgi:Uma2 family endonuclease
MNKIIKPLPADQRPDADLYRFGWRDVYRKMPDGTTTCDRVPLTFDDVVHPQEGDVIPQNTAHDRDWIYLAMVLKGRYADDPTALVGSDLIIYWDVPELRHHSPDVSVMFGVRDPRAYRGSFSVAEEGVRPAILFEVVSPNYRNSDIVVKVGEYHQARVPYYVIVDREHEEDLPRLIGYRYAPDGWVELQPDNQGRLYLEPVGLWLGTLENRVVFYDGLTGKELGDYAQVTRDLIAAEEAQKAAENAQMAAQTAQTAQQAAEDRAEAAERRAQTEAAVRAELEARLKALEAELRRRNDGQDQAP